MSRQLGISSSEHVRAPAMVWAHPSTIAGAHAHRSSIRVAGSRDPLDEGYGLVGPEQAEDSGD